MGPLRPAAGAPTGNPANTRRKECADPHRDHIDSAMYKALGFSLGSGRGESACRWLSQQRFEEVEMRWSEEGFNHLILSRVAFVKGEQKILLGMLSMYVSSCKKY